MTENPPPPSQTAPSRRGLGCFGIGCIVVVAVLLGFGALIAGLGYFGYSKLGALTSMAPTTAQNFDGGNAIYQSAQQKGNDFQQNLQQNRPATLEFTADELNTLIARDPDFARSQIHLFVSMTGDRGRVEVSLPGSLIPLGLIKDRYFNGNAEFGLGFDPATKNLKIDLHALKIGPDTIPPDQLPALQSQLQPLINAQLQNSPDAKRVLDQAQSIEIRDGKLVIVTK